jgi:hypothetical protein
VKQLTIANKEVDKSHRENSFTSLLFKQIKHVEAYICTMNCHCNEMKRRNRKVCSATTETIKIRTSITKKDKQITITDY